MATRRRRRRRSTTRRPRARRRRLSGARGYTVRSGRTNYCVKKGKRTVSCHRLKRRATQAARRVRGRVVKRKG